MKNEFDTVLTSAINKTKDKYGNSLILTRYIECVGKYFFAEYHINNYDYKELLVDICHVANDMIQNHPFNELTFLNQDEIDVLVAIAYDEVEKILKEKGFIHDI